MTDAADFYTGLVADAYALLKGEIFDGVDSSPDMIERARRAARSQGASVGLHVGRMEALDLGRSYASIYLDGPTFEPLPDDATVETDSGTDAFELPAGAELTAYLHHPGPR
ncbi:class I SAM-dependent methyltransferase [Serinicoccus kebangsaanensis]|uniref:class I SAM-dependent methyltransferase n=1 Tax=Serinicoccus kebangsaanensis TaxID=2602069 RepID=UPI00178C2442|nr:class I SAM-dependent methyltransferase [Serinicoccus kebangsaanensis]